MDVPDTDYPVCLVPQHPPKTLNNVLIILGATRRKSHYARVPG